MRLYYRFPGGSLTPLTQAEYTYWLWCLCAEPRDRHPRWEGVQLIAVEG